MQIGKLDNASASYIDPTAKAMRASADSASQGKADVTSIPAQSQAEDKPNTASELLESKDVYKLDISEEGQALAAMEKKPLADNKGVAPVVNGKGDDMTISVLKDGEITNVVNYSYKPAEDSMLHYDSIREGAEYDTLAHNMRDIEYSIAFAFEMCGKQDKQGGDVVLYWTLQHLGRALNAYGHKQREDIANGSDWYLQNLSDRLNEMDQNHPFVQRIRDMLNYTMSGRDIDVESDEFYEKSVKTWREYQTYIGQSPEKEETKPEDLFNEKFALYGYMQKLARWQAEHDAELLEEMTGEGDGKKENHEVGEVLRNTSLEDGLRAINDNLHHYLRSYYADGDTASLTEEQLAKEKEENEKEFSYAAGYNWNVLCQKFLKENPDMAEILS
mgnify:FL=1